MNSMNTLWTLSRCRASLCAFTNRLYIVPWVFARLYCKKLLAKSFWYVDEFSKCCFLVPTQVVLIQVLKPGFIYFSFIKIQKIIFQVENPWTNLISLGNFFPLLIFMAFMMFNVLFFSLFLRLVSPVVLCTDLNPNDVERACCSWWGESWFSSLMVLKTLPKVFFFFGVGASSAVSSWGSVDPISLKSVENEIWITRMKQIQHPYSESTLHHLISSITF